MDILTDAINLAGLKSRILSQREIPQNSTIQFPCSRSIGFHVALKGVVYIHSKNRKSPLMIQRGEIALMARGCDHFLSTEEKLSANFKTVKEFEKPNKTESIALTVVSGAYQLFNDPVHPFFKELPEWFVLKKEEVSVDDGLYQMMDLLGREISKESPGSERIIQAILDVIFSLIIRRVIKESGTKNCQWASAIQNAEVRKTLELLHGDIGRDWGLDELAKKVGVSRSGLAARFKKLTGDTPLHYLTTLRIQKAISLLTTSEQGLEAIAYEIGYKDSFTFSKAFKKLTGLPPRDYRRQYFSGTVLD
jgi:AraC-like DNA-binding protein